MKSVVIDAHFIERNRGRQLAGLLPDFPQFLGLGVDANTALFVQGSIGEVLGEGGGVMVYDAREGKSLAEEGLLLETGTLFDLVTGEVVEGR